MAKININFDLISPSYRDVTLALLSKLKEHSEESFIHSVDVAEKACILAGAFGIESSELKKLYTASLLHDIGKLYIDVDLLHKKNATEEDLAIIQKEHIRGTREILQMYFDPDIVRHAVHHHERLNSSGYPEQLHSGNLDVIDRIIQVADVTSALAMNRSYKDAYETSKVIEILDNLVKSGELDKNCVEIIERRFLNPLKNQTQQQPE